MSRKAFILTSTQYCKGCGSFDMIKDNPDWFNLHILRIKPIFVCHGCERKYSEQAIENNAPRNMPRTINAFFFQSNLRNQKLINKQLKPVARVMGYGLIVGTIVGMFQLPENVQTVNKPTIKWAATPENLSDNGFLKNADLERLQLEFGQVFMKAKKIPVSLKTGQ